MSSDKFKKRIKPTNPLAEQFFPKSTKADRKEKAKLKTRRIHFELPGVAEHVAKTVVKHHMDWRGAVAELLNEGRAETEKPSDQLIGSWMGKLQQAPLVQESLKKLLEVRGLTNKSQDAFILRMWNWLEGNDPVKANTAARILGRGFVTEKRNSDKPEPLPIEGMKEGVKQLLGAAADDLDLDSVSDTSESNAADERMDEAADETETTETD